MSSGRLYLGLSAVPAHPPIGSPGGDIGGGQASAPWLTYAARSWPSNCFTSLHEAALVLKSVVNRRTWRTYDELDGTGLVQKDAPWGNVAHSREVYLSAVLAGIPCGVGRRPAAGSYSASGQAAGGNGPARCAGSAAKPACGVVHAVGGTVHAVDSCQPPIIR